MCCQVRKEKYYFTFLRAADVNFVIMCLMSFQLSYLFIFFLDFLLFVLIFARNSFLSIETLIQISNMGNKYLHSFFFVLLLLVSLRTQAQERVSFNLHNRLIDEYLGYADSRYNAKIGREGTSVIDTEKDPLGDILLKKVNHTDLYRKPVWSEQPSYVSFFTKGGDRLLVSTSPDFSKSMNFSVASGDSTFVYNLEPQSIYWYRVMTNDAILSEGTIKTLGHVRMIKVDNVLNVRDLGGWSCTDGSTIAYGKLFRGGTLDGAHDSYVEKKNRLPISSASATMLAEQLGIKEECDLRGPNTGQSKSLIPNATYKVITSKVYVNFLDDTSYYPEIQKSLTYITNNLKNGLPTYFHCEWGADRTGSLAMVIGAICGVCEQDLVKDWELTSFGNHYMYKIISDGTDGSKMRKMFTNLYNNYGGKSGASLQAQVEKWLKEKVYANPQQGVTSASNVISILKDKLIVKNPKSPILLRGWNDKYSVVTDTQKDLKSEIDKYYNAEGTQIESDMYCTTDFVDCEGYTNLLVNVKSGVVAVCYDKYKKVLGKLTCTDVSEGTVLMQNAEFSFPSKTKYVRFNMPKYSGWSAVISNKSYLK